MLSKIRSAPVPLGSQAILSGLAMMFLAFSLLTATSLWGRETPEEFLKRNGVGLTKEGLIAALYNPDWTIRLNAGERIVTDREMTAATATFDVAAPTYTGIQVNQLTAWIPPGSPLLQLGPPPGITFDAFLTSLAQYEGEPLW